MTVRNKNKRRKEVVLKRKERNNKKLTNETVTEDSKYSIRAGKGE